MLFREAKSDTWQRDSVLPELELRVKKSGLPYKKRRGFLRPMGRHGAHFSCVSAGADGAALGNNTILPIAARLYRNVENRPGLGLRRFLTLRGNARMPMIFFPRTCAQETGCAIIAPDAPARRRKTQEERDDGYVDAAKAILRPQQLPGRSGAAGERPAL